MENEGRETRNDNKKQQQCMAEKLRKSKEDDEIVVCDKLSNRQGETRFNDDERSSWCSNISSSTSTRLPRHSFVIVVDSRLHSTFVSIDFPRMIKELWMFIENDFFHHEKRVFFIFFGFWIDDERREAEKMLLIRFNFFSVIFCVLRCRIFSSFSNIFTYFSTSIFIFSPRRVRLLLFVIPQLHNKDPHMTKIIEFRVRKSWFDSKSLFVDEKPNAWRKAENRFWSLHGLEILENCGNEIKRKEKLCTDSDLRFRWTTLRYQTSHQHFSWR